MATRTFQEKQSRSLKLPDFWESQVTSSPFYWSKQVTNPAQTLVVVEGGGEIDLPLDGKREGQEYLVKGILAGEGLVDFNQSTTVCFH